MSTRSICSLPQSLHTHRDGGPLMTVSMRVSTVISVRRLVILAISLLIRGDRSPVCRELGIHPVALARRELEHARVISEIHIIRDRVAATPAARVAPSRAAKRRRAFRRCVGDLVTACGSGTSALKCVIKPKPMAYFVHGDVTEIVWSRVPAWQGPVQHRNAVLRGPIVVI